MITLVNEVQEKIPPLPIIPKSRIEHRLAPKCPLENVTFVKCPKFDHTAELNSQMSDLATKNEVSSFFSLEKGEIVYVRDPSILNDAFHHKNLLNIKFLLQKRQLNMKHFLV